MKHPNPALPLALLLSLPLVGCDEAQTEDSRFREVVFDGEEMRDEIEQHPDTVFFVDLREDIIAQFDQSEVPIDFSKVLLQCPSMPAPVPMDQWLTAVDFEGASKARWSLQSEPGSAEGDRFRSVPCRWVCNGGGSSGSDCVWTCWSSSGPDK